MFRIWKGSNNAEDGGACTPLKTPRSSTDGGAGDEKEHAARGVVSPKLSPQKRRCTSGADGATDVKKDAGAQEAVHAKSAPHKRRPASDAGQTPRAEGSSTPHRSSARSPPHSAADVDGSVGVEADAATQPSESPRSHLRDTQHSAIGKGSHECDDGQTKSPLVLELYRQSVEEEAQVRNVASDFSVVSARLREMPETFMQVQRCRASVANWVKSTADSLDDQDKKKKYTNVMARLNEHEQGCDCMIMKTCDVASLCKETMNTMVWILETVKSNFGWDGLNAGSAPSSSTCTLCTWDSKLVEPQLLLLQQLLEKFAAHYVALQNMTDDTGLSNFNRAIQELENEIYTMDTISLAKDALKRDMEWNDLQYQTRQKRAADEAALGALEAMVEDCSGKIEASKLLIGQLEKRRGELEERMKALEQTSSTNVEQALDALRKLKADAQNRATELRKHIDAQLDVEKSRFREAHQEYQKKLRSLESELFDVDKQAANHIVFCIDQSGSMKGRRWEEALRALESFQAVRKQHGSQDLVSLVPFSDVAKQFVVGKPVTFDFVAKLRSDVCPAGGTRYSPAWHEISKCKAQVPGGSKLIVVFITDGKADDIPEAVEIAAALHQQQSDQGGMNTFVVNIDKVDDSVLEDLVKAGNGGQTVLQAFGEATKLLGNVETSGLKHHFQRLANLIDTKEVCLKHRISLVRATAEDSDKQQRKTLKQLEEQAELRLQSLKESCARAEQASDEDARKVKEALRDQKVELRQELHELEISLENENSRKSTLKGSLAKHRRDVEMQKTHLQETEKHMEEEKNALGQNREVIAEELRKLKASQEKLQRDNGSSDFDTLKERLVELDKLKRLCKVNFFQSRDQANGVGGLQRFFMLLCSSFREPMGETQPRGASKAEFVFGRLLPERGVTLKEGEQPDGLAGLRRYLVYLADSIGEESEHKRAIDLLFKCEIKSEELCRACEMEDPAEVETVKKELAKRLEETLFHLKGLGKQCKLQGKIKKLKAQKDDLEDLPERDDEAQAKLESLKEDIDEHAKELEDRKQELRELDELTVANRLVSRAVDDCRVTFRKQMQRQTQQNLQNAFRSYYEFVHKPMQELIVSADALVRSCGIAGPTEQCGMQLENGMSSSDGVEMLGRPAKRARV